MSDGTMRAVYYLVVGAVLLGGAGCSAPDPGPDPETATAGTVEQALTLPTLPALPAVPDAMRDKGGQLGSAWFKLAKNGADPLDGADACKKLHTEYGIPVGTSALTVDTAALGHMDEFTCQQFYDTIVTKDDSHKLVINQSAQITESCPSSFKKFDEIELEISAPNVQLHCGDNTFKGGEGRRKNGLTLSKNAAIAIPPEVLEKAEVKLPTTITNVHISHCKFENYADSGVLITNKFNRHNELDQATYKEHLGREPAEPWDSLDAPSPADYLRAQSPSGFYLGDISVKNTGEAAIYIHDYVQKIDINRLIARDTRQGVYMDQGSRYNTVRNSCFLQQKKKDSPEDEDKGAREFIAVDSSAGNTIKSNLFYKNVEGAVHLYKNCSEHAEHPDYPQQIFRRQSAHKNTISSNVIVGPDNAADYDAEIYGGIIIASRQWGHNLTNDTCSDEPAGQTSGAQNNIYRDYAQENQVLANVFFGPGGLAVWVRDDNNLVYGNRLYKNSIPLLVKVGTPGDSTYGHRPIVGNALIQNTVSSCCGVASVAFAVPPSLFEFLYGSMEHTEFAGNTYLNGAVCRSPFYVQSSNVPSEVCRFGSVDAPTLYFEGDPKTFTDGGRIHGSVHVECTDGGWLSKDATDYCCSGDGCEHKSLAGKYFDPLP